MNNEGVCRAASSNFVTIHKGIVKTLTTSTYKVKTLTMIWRNSALHYIESLHIALGPQIDMREMTLHFYVRNSKVFNSDQLKTYENFSLPYTRGGAGGC